MKTEISRFCGVCADAVAALPSALDSAAEQFERRADVLGGALAALNDVRAHLRSLTDKLKAQQAYLLIFGPLKSGKSTLMNAISGSYVSEVTSLPGYPCLVFVRNHETARYSTMRYNGRESVFSDKVVLADAVTEAHHSLAEQIRRAEGRGEVFDPRTTFPEAIRRIDIQLPVPSLAESSTVLVDTPGLYSRMNFGYDVLTREFRDSAACAVFVVKTDNLFLEQVFAEFNQLLGLFSRIFIVVNVDAGKRDLAPDGSLRPSAESEHPEKVIEAFTTLSMAGPLREAYEAGRVRLHAVDLLGAASEFLAGDGQTSRHRASFDAFLADLTEYLNSSDYTREFVRDSLKQGRSLCEEALELATGEEVERLGEQQRERGDLISALRTRLAAADRLLGLDWAGMFKGLHEENARKTAESIRVRVASAREEMRAALVHWYANTESLNALCVEHWNGLLTNTGRNLFDDIRAQVKQAVANETVGLSLSDSVIADLRVLGFSPAEAGAAALASLNPSFEGSSLPAQIAPESIPVRKSFLDWLLFRRIATVRNRLFGEDSNLEIPVQEKERRLREPARAAFEAHLESILNERFPVGPEKFAAEYSLDYATDATAKILRQLRELRSALIQQREDLEKPFAIDAAVLAAAVELENFSQRAILGIKEIAEKEGVQFESSLLPVVDPNVVTDMDSAPLNSEVVEANSELAEANSEVVEANSELAEVSAEVLEVEIPEEQNEKSTEVVIRLNETVIQ